MKYMVAHLVRGEAEKYARFLTASLKKGFCIADVSEKIMPHITIKAPFEAEMRKVREVERVVGDYVRDLSAFDYQLRGFGGFDGRVIFIDISENRKIREVSRELVQRLFPLQIEFSRHESSSTHPHLTLGRCKDKQQFKSIRKFLDGLEGIYFPSFNMRFDNLALLRKPLERWEVYKIFELQE